MHVQEAKERAGKFLLSIRDDATKGTLCLFPYEALHDEISKSMWAADEIVELRKRIASPEERAVIDAAKTWVDVLGKTDVIAAGLLLNTAVDNLRRAQTNEKTP